VFVGRLRSAPRYPKPFDLDPSHALTGPRGSREGPFQERFTVPFQRLGLEPELVRAVADQGYTQPTPVQAEAIPFVLAGRDVLAGAQTGTGKTAAFVLPMLQRLHASRPAGGPQSWDPRGRPDRRDSATRLPVRALILTPTRELALQIEESVRTYGAQRPIRSTTIYGGVGFDPQVRALRAGPEIVVATPGRLLDHLGQGTLDLSRVEILVLDEADRMLDMGFIRDIRKILALLPPRRQNLLFSATFSDEIRRLSEGILHDPAQVQVTPRNQAAELVSQVVHPVDRERKRELLSHLVRTGRIGQALVFTRTKHGASRLAEQLERDGIAATAIHGNKSQPQRIRALADFKAGRATILVATDIAARGIDIDSLPHVVNFEMPMVAEDYIHRIGRTGRAGTEGMAVSLICVDEGKLLWAVETLLRKKLASEVIEGFEPDRSIRPEPILLRSAGGGRPGQPSRQGGFARPGHARPAQPARPSQVTRSGQPPRSGPAMRPGQSIGGHAPAQRPIDRPHRSTSSRPIGRPVSERPGVQHALAHPDRSAGPGRGHGSGPSRDQAPRNGSAPSRDGRQMPQHQGDRGVAQFSTMPGERLARAGRRPGDQTGR
jgi:ATP-dependent RNA helicase RhlE